VTQVIEPNFAARVFALVGEQTRLEGEQAQGQQRRCALRAGMGIHPMTAVRHQAGGHIHAQQWRVRSSQKMHVLLQVALGRAVMTQSQ
jgi:hypothetical protein